MNNYSLLFALSFLLWSCTDAPKTDATTETDQPATAETTTAMAVADTPTKIEGKKTVLQWTIQGMEPGKKLFFDKKTLDATDVVATALLGDNGSYTLTAGITAPGIYRLRLGAAPVYLLLEGGETVDLDATVEGYKIVKQAVSGSLYADDMQKWAGKPSAKAIKTYLEGAEEDKPLLHLFLVEKLDLASNIKLYKKVLQELEKAYPDEVYTKQFKSKVVYTENKINAQPVAVGREAPNIKLPNPDGEEIALSSLKGKVVLLDFWASWCRPCRFANPHVVEMYDKYNSKGFTVYNVSLDGLDDRRMAMYQNDPRAIKEATENERKKWSEAITADKLRWKNHVSDLRGWSSPVAALYGVNSIPRTFLLDREGVIRFTNLRGQQLENALVELLNE